MSGNLPLLGLISKKQEEVLPQSLLDFHKLVSEADKTKPIDLNGKLKEYYFDEETVKKDQELKSEIAKPHLPHQVQPRVVQLHERSSQQEEGVSSAQHDSPCL